MLVRAFFITLLLALLAAGPAVAAPPWSAPETLAGSSVPTIEFGPGGHGFLSQGRSGWFSEPNGAFGTPVAFPSPGFFLFAEPSAMALERGDRFLAVGYRSYRGSSYLARMRGTLGGPIGRAERVGPAGAVRYAFAANSRGDAALLTQVSQRASNRGTRRRVYLQVRRAGGEFGRPIEIAGPGAPATLAVAINSRRQVLAVWSRDRRIAARRVSASRRRERARAIASIQPEIVLSAGLASSGLAAVAWAGGFAGESPAPTSGPYTVSVAAPGGSFTTSELDRVEDPGRGIGLGDVSIAATAPDRLMLGWTGRVGIRAAAKVAEVTAAGRGPTQVVSNAEADSALVKLVRGARGEDLALVVGYEDSGREIAYEKSALFAVPRVPGAAAFGAPEQITPFGNRLGADVAIEPVSGRVVATWLEFEAGVKLSTRPAIG